MQDHLAESMEIQQIAAEYGYDLSLYQPGDEGVVIGDFGEKARQIIEQARGHVAATANYTQTMMYWHIGERINREVLGNQRAEYGKQIVS